ncbi:MAG: hypothetical protein AAF432_01085 [Planctomycetota bacterium]
MRIRWLCVIPLALLFVGLAALYDWLSFAPARDEIHYWPTTLQFAAFWWPPVDFLRTYPELNTPLPFMIFGWLERLTGGGIAVGRWFNLFVTFLQACIILLATRGEHRRAILATVGVLAFPYFTGISLFLYTDAIANLFVLIGIWMWCRERYIVCGIAFTLAVASRQYTVAIPAALAVYGLAETWRPSARWIAPMIAAMTLSGWFILFGGPAPLNEIARQRMITSGLFGIVWHNPMYFLAAVGAWYVVQGLIIGLIDWRQIRASWRLAALIAVAIGAAMIIAPPLGNHPPFPIRDMGMLDRWLRLMTGDSDVLRLSLLGGLAGLAVLRFRHWSVASALVFAQTILMFKAHIMWDKYALPLIICLWFLTADEQPVHEPPTLSRPARRRRAAAHVWSTPVRKSSSMGKDEATSNARTSSSRV